MIRTLFPPDVIVLEATPEMWDEPLMPEEEVCVARAVRKRQREFAAGRACARRALAQLGIEGVALPSAPDRLPVWPAGIVGSLSHCRDFCGVAVARRGSIAGLGLDVEGAEPLEARLVEMICSAEELARAAASPPPGPAGWAKIIFSAKESFYKCWYPLARRFLGFHDVVVDFDPGRDAFTARLVAGAGEQRAPGRLRGRFACDARYVFTGVTLLAAELAGDDPR